MKNLLLIICGSISAYKIPDLVKSLTQKNKVKIICTKGSLEFINPSVFKYLGVEETYLPDDDFKHKGVLHIELSKWADSLVIVPASANSLVKFSHGQADDLASSVFLSMPQEKLKIIFPAMNTHMLNSPITQKNLDTLKSLPHTFIVPSDEGLLACGDHGEGKLPKIDCIRDLIETLCLKQVNKKVLLTAGATLSNLDPVRYVTNKARGGSSYLLAKKYLKEGYTVHCICGQDVISEFKNLTKHPNYTQETVSTTKDLLEAVKKQSFDIYISPMAVSDIEFDYVDSKIKKSTMGGSFNFTYAPDVLKYVVENKKEGQVIVGFAAETSLADSVIQEKITRKPVDLLVANLVNSGFNNKEKKGFGTRFGDYKIVSQTDTREYPNLPKEDMVEIVFKKVKEITGL